jgi:O-antigen/teichoic acid export membrane protein
MNKSEGNTSTNDSGSILSRGWITLFGAVLGAVLVFGNEILVARFLGVPLYGLYALALVIARIAETVSLFGLRSGLMHFLPVYLSNGDHAEATGSILAALLLPLSLGLVSVILVWVGAPWIAHYILDEPASIPYLRLFALPIPLMCMAEMLGVVTRGFGRAEFYVIIRNLTPPASYLLLLLLLIALDGDPFLVGRAFGFAQLIATTVGIVIVTKLMRKRSVWVRPKPLFSELYRYSFPIMLNTLLYSMMAASDILMLANLKDATDAGIYRACIQFRPAFDMAVLAFNAAAIHLYPVYHREGNTIQLRKNYDTVIRMTCMVTVTLFVLVFLSREDILGLLGPEFPVGAGAMLFLLVGFLFQGCIGSSGILLIVTGHQKHETLAALIGVIINVCLNLVLIPKYGIIGAGIATAVAMFVLNMLRVFLVNKYLKLFTLRKQVFHSLAIGGLIGGAVFIIAQLLGFQDGVGIVAMLGRSALALGLLLMAFWKFGPKERV